MQRSTRRRLLGRLLGASAVVAAMVLCALALPQRAEAAAPSWYDPTDQETLYWIEDCPYCGCSHAVNRVYIDLSQYEGSEPDEDGEGWTDLGVRTNVTGNITAKGDGSGDEIISAASGSGEGRLTVWAADNSVHTYDFHIETLTDDQVKDTLGWTGAHPNPTQGVEGTEVNEYHLSLIGDPNSSRYPRTLEVSQRIGSSTFRYAARALLNNEIYVEGNTYTLSDGKDYVFNGWDWPVDPDATMTVEAFGAGTSTTDPTTNMTVIDHTLTIKANFTPVEESGQQPGGDSPLDDDRHVISSPDLSDDKGATATIEGSDEAYDKYAYDNDLTDGNGANLVVVNTQLSGSQQSAVASSAPSSTVLGSYDVALYNVGDDKLLTLKPSDGLTLTIHLTLTDSMRAAMNSGKKLTVYYVPDDGGAPQAMQSWTEGNFICFKTNHLSTFIVLASNPVQGGGAAGGQSTTPQQTSASKNETAAQTSKKKAAAKKLPSTDDIASMSAVLAGAAVVAFAGAYAVKRFGASSRG